MNEKDDNNISRDRKEVQPTTKYDEKNSLNAKVEFLNGKIKKQIIGFDFRRKENRRNALIMKIVITTLGSLVTVLLGYRSATHQELLANIALVFSGVITIMSGLNVFFDYRSSWIRYTNISNRLRGLRDDFEYYLRSDWASIEEKEIDKFYERFTIILNEANETWLSSREKDTTIES